MRRWLAVLALAGCGAPTVATDAQTMDASTVSEGSVLLDAVSEESAVAFDAALVVDSSADARADHELFDGPYGGEPSAIGRCYNESWRSRQGYEVGSTVPPMSFRRCDVAGTYYPFYGREFCDARATVLLAFDQRDTGFAEAALPELRARVIDAYQATARVLVVSVSPTRTTPAPGVFECMGWASRYSLAGVAFVDEGGGLRSFAPPMTLPVPLAIIIDRRGIIRWKQVRGLSADVIRRELDAVLSGP